MNKNDSNISTDKDLLIHWFKLIFDFVKTKEVLGSIIGIIGIKLQSHFRRPFSAILPVMLLNTFLFFQ